MLILYIVIQTGTKGYTYLGTNTNKARQAFGIGIGIGVYKPNGLKLEALFKQHAD